MDFLPLLVAIGLAVGSGRCQNTCSLFWGIDPSLANWVPTLNPDAEKTGLDGVGCASKCTDYSWCSSFFIQTSGRCLMFRTIFLTTVKMVSSPGTVYNRIYSDDCPVEQSCYKSREHNLCLFFFGLGSESVRLNRQKSVDKCSAINGHLPILDTENKREWVEGVIKSNNVIFSRGWLFYLDGKRSTASSYVWGDGQPVLLGDQWVSFYPTSISTAPYMAATVRGQGIQINLRWVNVHESTISAAIICQYGAMNNRTG